MEEDDSQGFYKISKTIITELNGALCIAQTDLYSDSHSCTDMWLLSDSHNDIWSKVYTIHMGTPVDLLKPLRIMRDGRKLLIWYIHDSRSEPVLQVYDPYANTCGDVMVKTTSLTKIMGLCNLRLDRFI
jgi:hypothetical protein